jgi:hypothetical protein
MTSRCTRKALFAAALAALAAPVHAQGQHDICLEQGYCRAATEAELDALRGGFDMETRHGRLRVDIGITREVRINDRLVATSQLVIPDIGQFSRHGRHGGQGGSIEGPIVVNGVPVTNGPVVLNDGGALIVQNGPNNHAPSLSDFGTQSIPTIVQNTLDNQSLSTLTLINARLNSLALHSQMRIADMMSRATAASNR